MSFDARNVGAPIGFRSRLGFECSLSTNEFVR